MGKNVKGGITMQQIFCYDVRTSTSHYTGEIFANSEAQARATVKRMYPHAVSIEVWEK